MHPNIRILAALCFALPFVAAIPTRTALDPHDQLLDLPAKFKKSGIEQMRTYLVRKKRDLEKEQLESSGSGMEPEGQPLEEKREVAPTTESPAIKSKLNNSSSDKTGNDKDGLIQVPEEGSGHEVPKRKKRDVDTSSYSSEEEPESSGEVDVQRIVDPNSSEKKTETVEGSGHGNSLDEEITALSQNIVSKLS